MSKTRVYLATAIDKEIGSATYYVMDAERFSRILGQDVDGIEKTLAEIEEQTPAHIFTLVKDLIAFLQENDMEIAEEAVGVFLDNNPESATKAENE
jgi:hypothetical protein